LGHRTWDDPLSFRKATLFGISTGFTLWSCLWTLQLVRPFAIDTSIRTLLCGALVLEVFLITMQTWRGHESHFNHESTLDASIEAWMLLCISIAMLGILWITIRIWISESHDNTSITMRSAARWGMLFLVVSGAIGYLITYLGNQQMFHGNSPSIWNARGILKFPHGASLHAIQVLAILGWLVEHGTKQNALIWVHSLVLAHVLWLGFALAQTFRGRGRFEMDWFSWLMFASMFLTLLIPPIKIRISRICEA